MASSIALQGAPRIMSLKAKALRREGKVPAVLYGNDFASQNLQFDYLTIARVVQMAGTSRLVSLTIEGDDVEHTVLIREVQREPVSDAITHLDLYRLVAGVAISTEIPVVQVGVAPIIESMGGIVNQLMDTVEIECMPRDMPESLKVDVTSLDDFASFLTVDDLVVPPGVEVLLPGDTMLVRVLAPRSEEELEELAPEVPELEVEGEEGAEVIEGEGEDLEGEPEPEAAEE